MSPGAAVVLLRHGETAWNLVHRFQGQHDTELTDRGREQAAAAGESLARAAVGRRLVLVSSDLRRAQDTAAAVGRAAGVPVLLDPRLREIAAGEWQGLLQPEIEALDPVVYAAWRAGDDVRPTGGETPLEAGSRVAEAVREHARDLGPEDLLVAVGHGASIRSGHGRAAGPAGPATRPGAAGQHRHGRSSPRRGGCRGGTCRRARWRTCWGATTPARGP